MSLECINKDCDLSEDGICGHLWGTKNCERRVKAD